MAKQPSPDELKDWLRNSGTPAPHRPHSSVEMAQARAEIEAERVDDLAEAERYVRSISETFAGSGRHMMDVVMAEFDRLKVENTELRELLAIRDEQVEENKAIIEAAYRVAASWSPHSMEEFDGDLVAALVREVQR